MRWDVLFAKWGMIMAIFFGAYCLIYSVIYIITKKIKGTIKPSSFIARIPLIVGCANICILVLAYKTTAPIFDDFMDIYVLFVFIPITLGTIVTSLLISPKMFLYVVLLNVIYSTLGIVFVLWIVGSAVVFELYNLWYAITNKIKGFVNSSSLVVRMPLIIGGINTLLLISVISAYNPQYNFILLVLPCIIIGTIAFSNSIYKKQLISLKRFILIFILNASSFIYIYYIPITIYT